MPRVPSISPATGEATPSHYIHTTDCNFVDNAGRTLLLRGVNLSGSSKAPVDRPSYLLDDFWESGENGSANFIGRPLDLEDGSADVHLARLRGWGFNMLRFPVTWEAIEHEGPGIYDHDFMDYIVRVLRKCKEYGFKVFMDPHQDVWSRFSGGSGAPYWTLAACGINPRNFTATQAAIVHCEYPLAHELDPASLPAMIWATNYGRLLSRTMFTLFFAGRDLAPKCIIDGMNIQDWLQKYFIEAMGQLADKIRDAGDLFDECVIGWDSMNEPAEGLVGWEDLNVCPAAQGSTLKKGTYPTPAQSMRLGMGQAQTVDNYTFGAMGPSKSGSVTIDPKGLTIWADPSTEGPDGVHPKWGWKRDPGWKLGICVWALHGVWDVETGYIIRPDYFRIRPSPLQTLASFENGGDTNTNDDALPDVEFIVDYWKPHWQAYSARIRSSHPEAIMFIQPPVFAIPPPIGEDLLKGRAAFSGHYYDGLTLVTRHWHWFNADALGLLRGKYSSPIHAVKIGEGAIRKSFQEQLGILKSDALVLGDYPTLLGEIGTPIDMDDKRSYGWTDKGKYQGDYSRQEKALDASLNGADGENCINYTIWTYCPDSCHDWGDGWNMEDLSLWSEDDTWERRKEGNTDSLDLLYRVGVGRATEQTLLPPPNSQSELLNLQSQSLASLSAVKKGIGMGSKDNGIVNVQAAAASSLSVSTLGIAAPSVLAAQRDQASLQRWRQSPYDFLTDGARAVRAFCRPYPTKVVGKSVGLVFDIQKAWCKITVLVRAEDKPIPKHMEDWKKGSEQGQVQEQLPTEIYVPLVHYMHQKLIPKTLATGHDGDEMVQSTSAPSTNMGPSASASASMLNLLDFTYRPSNTNTSSNSSPTITGADLNYTTSRARTQAGETMIDSVIDDNSDSDWLSLDVTVSDGRWEVQGQMLKWWYDVPAEGEPERTYTIEIRRAGGVIKAIDVERSCWEGLCPPGGMCRVM